MNSRLYIQIFSIFNLPVVYDFRNKYSFGLYPKSIESRNINLCSIHFCGTYFCRFCSYPHKLVSPKFFQVRNLQKSMSQKLFKNSFVKNSILKNVLQNAFRDKTGDPNKRKLTYYSTYYILYYKIQSVCVCVSMYVCWSGIGSKTMRTTVMKLLQVTQWV